MKRLFSRQIRFLIPIFLLLPFGVLAVEKVSVTSKTPITMTVKKQQSLVVQGTTVQNARSASILSARNKAVKGFTTRLSCKAPARKGAKGSCDVKLTITGSVPLGKYTLNLLDGKRQVLAAGQFDVKVDPAVARKQQVAKQKAAQVAKQKTEQVAKKKAVQVVKQNVATEQKKVLSVKQKSDVARASAAKKQQAEASKRVEQAAKKETASDKKKVLLAKQKATVSQNKARAGQLTTRDIVTASKTKEADPQMRQKVVQLSPDKKPQLVSDIVLIDAQNSTTMTGEDRAAVLPPQGGSGFGTFDPPLQVTAPDGTQVEVGTVSQAVTIYNYKINDDSGLTNNRDVVLYHNTTNNPTHYRIAESSNWAQVQWKPYTPNPDYTLSMGEGVKTVYLQVKGQNLTDRFGGSQLNTATVSTSITYGELPITNNSSAENVATSCDIRYNFGTNRSVNKTISRGSSIDINVSDINYVTNRSSSNSDARFDFAPHISVSDITLEPSERNPSGNNSFPSILMVVSKPTLEKVVCLDSDEQSGTSLGGGIPSITTPLALAQTLRAAGNTADSAASQMNSILDATPSQIGTALQAAGYSINEIAAALRNTFDYSRDQVQEILQTLQYSADQIQAALDWLFGAAVSAGAQVGAAITTESQVVATNMMKILYLAHGADNYYIMEGGVAQCTYPQGSDLQIFGGDTVAPMPLPNDNLSRTITIFGSFLHTATSISGLPSGASASIVRRGNCGIRLSIRVPESVSSEGNTTGIALLMVGNERGASFVYSIGPIPPKQPRGGVGFAGPSAGTNTNTGGNTPTSDVNLIPVVPLAALYRLNGAVTIRNPSTGDYYTLLNPADNSFCDGLDDIDPLKVKIIPTEEGGIEYDESFIDTSAFANVSDVFSVQDIVWGVTNTGADVSGSFTISLEYAGQVVQNETILSLGPDVRRTYTYRRPQSTIRVAKLTTAVIPGVNTNSDSSNCYHVGSPSDGWNDNLDYWVNVDILEEIDESMETDNSLPIVPRPR